MTSTTASELRPARALPTPVRPFADETVVSFIARLAAANHLHFNSLCRHLATVFAPGSPGRHVLQRDAVLNPAALARLAAVSAIPVARLKQALPTLNDPVNPAFAKPLPNDVPALRWVPLLGSGPFAACPSCTRRRGTTSSVLIRLRPGEHLCTRHGIWLRGTQIDLTDLPETVRAQVAYRRLRHQHPPRQLEKDCVQAEVIVFGWRHHSCQRDLNERWHVRLQALAAQGHSPIDYTTNRAVMLPETVTLADLIASCRRAGRSPYGVMVDARPRLQLSYRTAFCESDALAQWIKAKLNTRRLW